MSSHTDKELLQKAKVIIEQLTSFWMDNPNWYKVAEDARKFTNELSKHN